MSDHAKILNQIEMIDEFMLPGTGELLWGVADNVLKHANIYAYIICVGANAYSAIFSTNSLK
jgi:hypothetical protein